MMSIGWTYAWTSIAAVSFVVRAMVLRVNLRDFRLVQHPDLHASGLMRTIAVGHVRVSLALAFISISNTVVGVAGLILHHRPTEWLATAIGYFFVAYFIASEVVLTWLAWNDLRIRRSWIGDPGDKR
jgi:hypothetical protein